MKRILPIMALLLLPLHASAFSDVPPTHEARRAIEYLQQAGVLKGYPDGLFRPAFSINRAELLKVLVAARGIDPPPELYSRCFPDVTDEWFAPYVCLAALQGWVQGYPDGTFKPERPVAFVEALKMLATVRGYPLAPADESRRRGVDPSSWFAPYLTTALLLDVVSYEQVWGESAIPLSQSLNRGTVAEFLYRSLLAESAVRLTFDVSSCTVLPTHLVIKTYVDVLQPSGTRIFRQELHAANEEGQGCLLAGDANPFGRVTSAFDGIFLQPYPSGQPAGAWTATVPLNNGRTVLRAGLLDGTFRPELFVADVYQGQMSQMPSIFAARGETVITEDEQYVAFIGAAGRTVEAVDLLNGVHALVDAVQQPFAFAGLALTGGSTVRYTVYDTATPSDGGYLELEIRSADLPTAFSQSNPFSPFTPSPSGENPFETFGESSPTFP